MNASHFDTRDYPILSAREGYGAWASTYEDVVLDAMDLRLLSRVESVAWSAVPTAADLACGTGRIGVWLAQQGITALDGVDFTAAMLERARSKGAYRQLLLGDVRGTPLPAAAYDLVTISLADEHLPDVQPLYQEAVRLTRPGGHFVIVGYHPFFLMNGVPTHFDSADGTPVSIQCYVHLFSDHVRAAHTAGWSLREMHEGLIDDDFLALKPKWARYRNQPISFAVVWQHAGR
ncbi:MAG: methyltransferase domain-containing protein [Chloroflexi bacterium]|nr:methyltransferase domain-containing protein [Chloroflexota bacterium]